MAVKERDRDIWEQRLGQLWIRTMKEQKLRMGDFLGCDKGNMGGFQTEEKEE